jgi:hypothetical protein
VTGTGSSSLLMARMEVEITTVSYKRGRDEAPSRQTLAECSTPGDIGPQQKYWREDDSEEKPLLIEGPQETSAGTMQLTEPTLPDSRTEQRACAKVDEPSMIPKETPPENTSLHAEWKEASNQSPQHTPTPAGKGNSRALLKRERESLSPRQTPTEQLSPGDIGPPQKYWKEDDETEVGPIRLSYGDEQTFQIWSRVDVHIHRQVHFTWVSQGMLHNFHASVSTMESRVLISPSVGPIRRWAVLTRMQMMRLRRSAAPYQTPSPPREEQRSRKGHQRGWNKPGSRSCPMKNRHKAKLWCLPPVKYQQTRTVKTTKQGRRQ